MVIVVVRPLAQLLIEQVNVVGNAVLVQELVELLVVDAMRSFDLAVEVGCPRPDVRVTDIALVEVPVEVRLELGAIVRLHDVYAER